MIYLNDETVKKLNLSWSSNIQVIEDAVKCISRHDTVQPVKPYLRYGDPRNRIIAMPAYTGGSIHKSGIKWIASFPGNIHKGLPRAHSVTILNDADTGVPAGIINSGSLSAIRTASVSGFIISQFMKQRKAGPLKVGMTGFGPIGQHHLSMCEEVLADAIEAVYIFDLRPVKEVLIPDSIRQKVLVVKSWEEAYSDADIFITCTVSAERYIDKQPKSGSLHLNVSLRDYKSEVFPWFKDGIIVDSWEEICRENTDIEFFHKTGGLGKHQVKEIQHVLQDDCFSFSDEGQPVMFNPMGMAVFDIAIAGNFIQLAQQAEAGVVLE